MVREDSPRAGRRSTESRRLSSLSTADEDEDTVDGSPRRSTRMSPRRKASMAMTGDRNHSDSDESAEDTMSEHQVGIFMERLQDEIHDVSKLAHSLEHTLQDKYYSSKGVLRRASKDLTHAVSKAIGGVKEAVHGVGKHDKSHRQGGRHRGVHSRHHHGSEDDEGWVHRAYDEVKHRVVDCAGACGFSTCMSRNWQKVHDVGSSSTGFVWITFVVELAVFMSMAHSHHGHKDGESWSSCLSFMTDWPNFLLPFFAYYGTLFVIPTLLSQLFNVDRARKMRHDTDEHHQYQTTMTGLLSRTTTSGLSYFVFKFAMTYCLSQYALEHPVSSASRLTELAKEAVETAASYSGFGDHHPHHPLVSSHLWNSSHFVSEVFRFVPASLGLAIAGSGTVLALAETVVSRRK
ncbi:hypothetical protein BGX31_008040 [Mortierella sp. GBA43]|nr:hypothetical protein BGX31_008040 [Mortierella sp. GBA43]